MCEVTLVSTVVAPVFSSGRLELEKLTTERLISLLPYVHRNLCGHPVTDKVLREMCPYLPVPERAFWDGYGPALAVRPKGGVRNARAEGDTEVTTINELEAVLFRWIAE